jgi:hypothetical protein
VFCAIISPCPPVPEVGVTQIGATYGGAVSIKVAVSVVSEMEKKYSGTLLLFKG